MIAKRLKGIQPFVADSDAATNPIDVSSVVRIRTSLNHALPCPMQRCFCHAMSCRPYSDNIVVKTTARSSVAFAEALHGNAFCVSAVTLAQPHDIAAFALPNRAKRDKATKSLIGDIFSSFGKRDILGLHRESPVLGVKAQRHANVLGYLCGGLF